MMTTLAVVKSRRVSSSREDPKRTSQVGKGAAESASLHEGMKRADLPPVPRPGFFARLFEKSTLLHTYTILAETQLINSPKKWFVLVPDGAWRPYWHQLLLFVSSIQVVNISFAVSICHHQVYSPLNVLIDLVFVFDIVLTCVSAFPTASGELELNPRQILKSERQTRVK